MRRAGGQTDRRTDGHAHKKSPSYAFCIAGLKTVRRESSVIVSDDARTGSELDNMTVVSSAVDDEVVAATLAVVISAVVITISSSAYDN